MPISLALRGPHADTAEGRDAWAESLAVLRDVDRVFSTYRPDSFVSRMRRGEVDAADGPAEVREVLALAELARCRSEGAFDVDRVPGGFDPSGVVKGWAVERAALGLRRLADTDFCLSAGGDMVCHLAHPDDPTAKAWRVGVEHPTDRTRLVAVVPVRRGAVATSGLAHRGGHVVDARTGEVPGHVASVTVVGSDLTWADIDATSAFAQGPDAARWLSHQYDRHAVVVWADGRAEVVRGWV
ncbi:MAG: thiamine biosynthesis protein ApbE [Nocardioides sp.]|nr:thiamine biosynthesis protein ApbE [Nocardioides sp.]